MNFYRIFLALSVLFLICGLASANEKVISMPKKFLGHWEPLSDNLVVSLEIKPDGTMEERLFKEKNQLSSVTRYKIIRVQEGRVTMIADTSYKIGIKYGYNAFGNDRYNYVIMDYKPQEDSDYFEAYLTLMLVEPAEGYVSKSDWDLPSSSSTRWDRLVASSVVSRVTFAIKKPGLSGSNARH